MGIAKVWQEPTDETDRIFLFMFSHKCFLSQCSFPYYNRDWREVKDVTLTGGKNIRAVVIVSDMITEQEREIATLPFVQK